MKFIGLTRTEVENSGPGNPAVIGNPLRPVTLRPHLSMGLPLIIESSSPMDGRKVQSHYFQSFNIRKTIADKRSICADERLVLDQETGFLYVAAVIFPSSAARHRYQAAVER